MEFKDYYATLGVPRDASPADIKSAYKKLARKYHPDVSKEADAEARFKELGEANAVLKDPEKRAAYDQMGSQWQNGQDFQPPPGWDAGFEFSGSDFDQVFGQGANNGHSDFFEALFGRQSQSGQRSTHAPASHAAGQDHHAKIMIDLLDAYQGAQRSISLRLPLADAHGHISLHNHQLDVSIPKGIHAGQHLRLAGQGSPASGQGKAGDLYLEIAFNPHRQFRAEGRDVFLDLPLTPWEAALGAVIATPTPTGEVQLTIPPGSLAGRQMRLSGRGIPASSANAAAGNLYAVLRIVLPPADSDAARDAYRAMAMAFNFNPRQEQQP